MGIVLTDIDLLNMNTAISANFLLWTLLMFSCPDPGWTTQAEEMASLEVKMINIMDRMTRMEAEMVVKDQRIAVLEAVVESHEKTMITKDVFTEAIETRDIQMRGMVDQVRNSPFAFQCAWKKGPWTAADSVITYDLLTTDEISGSSMYNVTGGLDINTGVFTVGQGFSGVWEVTFSIQSNQQSGETNQADLYINGRKIEESHHGTRYKDSQGEVLSLGSRSLYLRLQSGDTISLRTGTVGTGLWQ